MLTFDDVNGDGRIQFVGPDSPLANELTVDNDIIVLANPEIAGLPNWVVGLVAAGGLAAALSTAAGLLLVVSSAVSHDLLKRSIMPVCPRTQGTNLQRSNKKPLVVYCLSP